MPLENLALKEARKIAIHSQQALNPNKSGKSLDCTHSVIQKLGYVQIDTISVVQRAHHHTLWNRNVRYKPTDLDRLQQSRKIFEYWSHAAAYLPIEDYRMCLPRMQAIRGGDALWFKAEPKLKRKVLERIRAEGPLQSRDFENHGKTKLPMWEWKPAKYALETLFMEGKLMVLRREGFQKIYDLTERVLPGHINTDLPKESEFCEMLVNRYLDAHGFGDASEIAYLRKGMKKPVQQCLERLAVTGTLRSVNIEGREYFLRTESLDLLSKPLSRAQLKILSPFDNLVIQRKRIQQLFDYDYQIECYVPAKKRKYGYFCLPLLWNAELVGRMDCKADRQTAAFVVRKLFVEKQIKNPEKFVESLLKELKRFMAFNGCNTLTIDHVSDRTIKQLMKRAHSRFETT